MVLSTAKYLADPRSAPARFNSEAGWQGVRGGLRLVSRGYLVLIAGAALGLFFTHLASDDSLLADAHVAAALFSDGLIAADKQLDVIGGSAGGILGLLRLYRDSHSADVLNRAIKCGEHLIAQSRLGPEGGRSWVGQGMGKRALNGMSHGAAGFAYALDSLAAATGREDFAAAAAECKAETAAWQLAVSRRSRTARRRSTCSRSMSSSIFRIGIVVGSSD